MLRALLSVLLGLAALSLQGSAKVEIPPGNAGEYNFDGPKTILELQQFRLTSSIAIRAGQGRRGVASLVNLNPAVNAWFLLNIKWGDAPGSDSSWHLQNPRPRQAQILLDEKYPAGLVITEGSSRYFCDLFNGAQAAEVLEQGRKSRLIYYPLCGGRLYLRNPAKGQRSTLEAATEFLRNQVWGGEKVIILFHHLMGERYRETADARDAGEPSAKAATSEGPLAALVNPVYAERLIGSANLGITLNSLSAEKKGMAPGAWYRAAGNDGVYLSILQPNFIAPAVLQSYKNLVSNLDGVEASSLCYLIAFDLDKFELGFAVGTEYPSVGWSSRVLPQMKDERLPGPDGVGTMAPLVSTGMISPAVAPRTIATFTGGFKRTHGAFRYGDLASKNHGSHYGFIEDGVVLSKLQPGLSTIIGSNDGSLEMKTWGDADNVRLDRIRFARQNGVPLVEPDETSRAIRPGKLVTRWGPGNWSGSEDEKLRTLRAGAALQAANGKRFLIYAVFSDATPSAMARVFQAYQANYAMLTDMNALEHTYLAVYRKSGSEMSVEHLLKGMSQLDKPVGGQIVPRFLGFPDNRDFFYVMRKEGKP